MNDFIRNIYQQTNYGNIIYSFEGRITGETINDVTQQIETSLNACELKPGLLKKVYRVTIESVQNLFHHIDDVSNKSKNADVKFAIFLVAVSDTEVKISSGNFIKSDQVRLLKNRIDQVNALDAEELKILYREILGNEEFTKKGGGGLGLVDVARKTGNKLAYEFHAYNDEYSYLTLDMNISRT